jgi:hypothetical protein
MLPPVNASGVELIGVKVVEYAVFHIVRLKALIKVAKCLIVDEAHWGISA